MTRSKVLKLLAVVSANVFGTRSAKARDRGEFSELFDPGIHLDLTRMGNIVVQNGEERITITPQELWEALQS